MSKDPSRRVFYFTTVLVKYKVDLAYSYVAPVAQPAIASRFFFLVQYNIFSASSFPTISLNMMTFARLFFSLLSIPQSGGKNVKMFR